MSTERNPLQPLLDPGCELHDPELYSPYKAATGVPSLKGIGENENEFYNEHGYLVVENALNQSEISEIMAVINYLSTNGWQGINYEANSADGDRKPVRKLAFFGEEARECGLLVDHEGILKTARMLLGNREPILHQTMMLLKPAHVGREKPWHQDHAYFDVDIEDRMIGVWIALDEATVDNGCLQVLDGGHKLGPIPHWKRRDWQICDTDIMGKKSVSIPLKPGGAVFFDSLLPHGTPNNQSPLPRKALQIHFAPANRTLIETEDRLAVFGSEGIDVIC